MFDFPKGSRGTHIPSAFNLPIIPPSTSSNSSLVASPSQVSKTFSSVPPNAGFSTAFPSGLPLLLSVTISEVSLIRGVLALLRGDSGIGLNIVCFPLSVRLLKGRNVER